MAFRTHSVTDRRVGRQECDKCGKYVGNKNDHITATMRQQSATSVTNSVTTAGRIACRKVESRRRITIVHFIRLCCNAHCFSCKCATLQRDGRTDRQTAVSRQWIESLSFNCNVQHNDDARLGRQTYGRIVPQSAKTTS